MGLVCIHNESLLVYSKSHKVSASYCLPFQHRGGKNQPVGGFRPPPPACLGLTLLGLFLLVIIAQVQNRDKDMAKYGYINVFRVGMEKNSSFTKNIYAWPSVDSCSEYKYIKI